MKPSLWERRTSWDPHLGQLRRASSDDGCAAVFESGFGSWPDSPAVPINGEHNMYWPFFAIQFINK